MLSGLPPSVKISVLVSLGQGQVKSSHFAGPAKLALPRALRPAARGERSSGMCEIDTNSFKM